MATKMVTLTAHISGWWETGRTSLAVTVRTSDYDPRAETGKQITGNEEVHSMVAEIFMTEYAADSIITAMGEAMDSYLSHMGLTG